jgi:hypothetical protein
LRCPFGCREAHRKQRSTRRSTAYYRTQEGKSKKSLQNGRRGRPTEREPEELSRPETGTGDWNVRMVEHVRVVAGLIEGRRVGLDEILEMLSRALRQHSLGRVRRIDYIVGQLNKAPP